MMQLQNLSKSLLPIDRETLLALCEEYEKDPKKLRRHGELSQASYPLYVADITGFRPCEICNGPRGRAVLALSRVVEVPFCGRFMQTRTNTDYSPIRCLRFPIHSIVTNSRDPLSNWGRIATRLCEHGYYVVECKQCMEVLYDKSKYYPERIAIA